MTEKPPLNELEPGAILLGKADPQTLLPVITQLSMAISLKRIADAMTGPTNEWGETMAEAVGGNIRRACMDISSIVHNAMNSGRR